MKNHPTRLPDPLTRTCPECEGVWLFGDGPGDRTYGRGASSVLGSCGAWRGAPGPRTRSRSVHDTNEDVGSTFPSAEESLAQLQGAGWSVVCTRFQGSKGAVWIVSGHNGENQVL